jgi:hypothetical protein
MTPNERRQVRGFIRRYAEKAYANRANIHYSQARPYTHLGVPPGQGFTCDCSGFVTGAYYWADKWCSFPVEDPNGQGYVRYPSYTGTLYANNRDRRIPLDRNRTFFVGDVALYGPSTGRTSHCTICVRNGKEADAVWASHGSEAGPYMVRLRYRSDLLCVVRPKALA